MDDYTRYWLDQDGKNVTIRGNEYTLQCKERKARYPYPREYLLVHAIPVNQESEFYLERKRELGDDWFVNVLDSDRPSFEDITAFEEVALQLPEYQGE